MTCVAWGIGPGVSTIPPERDETTGNDYDRFPFFVAWQQLDGRERGLRGRDL